MRGASLEGTEALPRFDVLVQPLALLARPNLRGDKDVLARDARVLYGAADIRLVLVEFGGVKMPAIRGDECARVSKVLIDRMQGEQDASVRIKGARTGSPT